MEHLIGLKTFLVTFLIDNPICLSCFLIQFQISSFLFFHLLLMEHLIGFNGFLVAFLVKHLMGSNRSFIQFQMHVVIGFNSLLGPNIVFVFIFFCLLIF